VVVGAVLAVALEGHAEERVGGVHPYAPLEAAAREVAAVALHEHLLDEVVRALVEVREPVDLLAGQRRTHTEEVAAALGVGAVEGGGEGAHGGRDERVTGKIRDPAPHHVGLEAKPP
jgi:hypothetical protein